MGGCVHARVLESVSLARAPDEVERERHDADAAVYDEEEPADEGHESHHVDGECDFDGEVDVHSRAAATRAQARHLSRAQVQRRCWWWQWAADGVCERASGRWATAAAANGRWRDVCALVLPKRTNACADGWVIAWVGT